MIETLQGEITRLNGVQTNLVERIETLEKKLEQKDITIDSKDKLIQRKKLVISQSYKCKYSEECPVLKKHIELGGNNELF